MLNAADLMAMEMELRKVMCISSSLILSYLLFFLVSEILNAADLIAMEMELRKVTFISASFILSYLL